MNHGFKLRFDQMRESDPASTNEVGQDAAMLYETAGHVRNICFVWPDGKKAFYNYAYLVAGEFEPNGEQNEIRLSFSSHNVTLKGYSLETLYMALLDHLPRIITASDPRYILDDDKAHEIVVEITVQQADT